MLEKQCPRCGRLENREYGGEPLAFVGFFCQDCFLSGTEFFSGPKGLLLRKCSRCGRARFNKVFEEFTQAKFVEWVVEKVKPKYKLESFSGICRPSKGSLDAELSLNFIVHGQTVNSRVTIKVAIDSNACPECALQSGGYHEALIQLRGTDREKLLRLAEKLEKDVKKTSFIVAVVPLKEGIDIQVGGKPTALRAVANLRRKYTTTHTLVGQKRGKRLFRDTILIRV